tara:strand:+ start:873 stop:1121 length:249 start_codon:yes stop_codon:yes gene_type:complete
MLLFAGFEDAFIGVSSRFGSSEPVATYDRDACIEILMRDGGSREAAVDHFEYNVAGSWVGEGTPIFLERLTLKEAEERYAGH